MSKRRGGPTSRDTEDAFEAHVWRCQYDAILEEHDTLRTQLHAIRRQQAQLAERAARLRLQIALRDRKRVEDCTFD